MASVIAKLEQRLSASHPSMLESANPLLRAIKDHKLTLQGIKEIIRQWWLLQGDAIEALEIGGQFLNEWGELSSCLKQCIHAEKAETYNGLSFREALKQALSRYPGLDISTATPSSNTTHFRKQIQSGLAENSPAFVAGTLYGIQSCNCLELPLLTALVESYAVLIQQEDTLLPEMDYSHPTVDNTAKELPRSDYLKSLLTVSVLRMRSKNKDDLSLAIERTFSLPQHSSSLQAGFDFVLYERERWWKVNSLIYRAGIIGQLLRWSFGDQDSGGFYGAGRTYIR